MIYGPMSDRYGRRPVILAALALNCVAAVFCALTTSIGALIVARFVQALGGAGSSCWRVPWCATFIPAFAPGVNCR